MNIQKHKELLPVYLEGLCNGKYTLAQAAASTGYSVVWLCNLKKQYKQNGEQALIHKNKGRVPNNKISQNIKNKIIELYKSTEYNDITFNYFAECLEKYEKIKISASSVHNIMAEFGIDSPEKRKVPNRKKTHRPRVRRDNFGDMLQIDGSPFEWFCRFGDNKRYCMHGAIDDTTSKITSLYITENECLYGYLEILRQTINKFGCPRDIYSDRSAIFCCTPKQKQNLTIQEELQGLHEKRTQWQRILADLHINQILAWSAQAKGRVERMWLTLQKRLPTELFIAGCDTVEKANVFLKKYVDDFNLRFGVTAMKPESFFVPCFHNLDNILSAQFWRKTDSSGCVSFHKHKFAIMASRVCYRNVILHISENGIFAKFENDPKTYPVKLIGEHLNYGTGETMPQVVRNIVEKYIFADGKEVSA